MPFCDVALLCVQKGRGLLFTRKCHPISWFDRQQHNVYHVIRSCKNCIAWRIRRPSEIYSNVTSVTLSVPTASHYGDPRESLINLCSEMYEIINWQRYLLIAKILSRFSSRSQICASLCPMMYDQTTMTTPPHWKANCVWNTLSQILIMPNELE